MIDLRLIDELTRKLSASLPPGAADLREDIERQFRAILSRNLQRLDLVPREDFEAQKAVLERLNARLGALEAELESLRED